MTTSRDLSVDLTSVDGTCADLNPAATRSVGRLSFLPRRPGAATLVDVFAATLSRHGGRTAVEAEDGRRTYSELYEDVHAAAAALRAAGVGVGDRVGVRVPSGTVALYTAILAVLHVGAAYVPIDADDPDARAEAAWTDAEVCAVVTDGGRVEVRRPGRDAVGFAHPDSDAWVIFTSGSTGRPKGVAVSHRSAAAFVAAEAQLLHVTADDRVAASLSVGFDASCEEMWLAWRAGATLVAAPREVVRSGEAFGGWLRTHAITVVSTVPTLAAMWRTSDLDTVRLLILGGEACPDELGWRLAADREVWNTYGPTEATVVTTATRILPGRPVSIGSPLPGWEVAVVDASGAPLQHGEEGELAIAGIGLARYLDPDLDTARYAPLPALGWQRAYRTGDVVRQTRDGLAFIGRRDDQVKVGGRRIELTEVTAHLLAVPGVRSGVCVVRNTVAGNPVLVGYVVSDVEPAAIRAALQTHLPDGLVPIVAPLERLPMSSAGKVDRSALPWPLISAADLEDTGLEGTEAWLAELWQRHLGVRPGSRYDDFFALGGSSLAAAKLTSEVRERFPDATVADIYRHRSLGALAARLDGLSEDATVASAAPPARRTRWAQIAAFASTFLFHLPGWIVGIGVYDDLTGTGLRISWALLAAMYLVLLSPWGRVGVAALARALLLRGVRPGRYRRGSGVTARVWLLDRIGDAMQIDAFGGTPFAAPVARMLGMRVAKDAALGSLPSLSSLAHIGSGATVEGDADVQGWTVEGDELIIGEVTIGDGARIGARALLSPGVHVGDYAEVEPASLVTADVPAGERWAGSPAAAIGAAGGWPTTAVPAHPKRYRVLYAGSLTLLSWVPAMVAFGVLTAFAAFVGGWDRLSTAVGSSTDWVLMPVVAACFVATDAVLLALLARLVGRCIRAGWHPLGRVSWAYWLHSSLMGLTRTQLFPLYCSSVTRAWLRLAGIRVGHGTEISTAVGLGPLVTLGTGSFLADDVVFNVARAHRGWLHLRPITVGNGVFIGNGAMIEGGTVLGDASLVGVQTVPPAVVPVGTSWFGVPALEFPRTADAVDPARTLAPPRRLRLARSVCDVVRVLLPSTVSTVLAFAVFNALDAVGAATHTVWSLVLAVPLLLAAAGLGATAVTAVVKWVLMGRYRPGDHPFFSWFVWRDEIVNSVQETLAGPWLIDEALGTPVMTPYLRLMGTQVGRDTWVDTLTISEFDVVSLGDGAVANRRSCIESHLFHDRLMRIGPVELGADASVGVSSAVLPDTHVGDGVVVDGRSVVLRGERVPAGTRWAGAPILSV